MKEPKKVVVGYQTIPVSTMPVLVEDKLGRYDSKEPSIHISDMMKNKVERANTLLHEVLHAIWHTHGLDLVGKTADEIEETVVNSLTNGLIQVIRDNPEFVKYLVKNVASPQT